MQKGHNQKGFTLVELMVVVVIIGILAAIAVPVYKNVQTNAAENAHNANVRILQGAAASCIMTEGLPSSADVTWDGSASGNDTHKWENYLDTWPTNPIKSGDNAGSYSVGIDQEGTITVSPDKVN